MRRPRTRALRSLAGVIMAGALILGPQAVLRATTVPPPKCDHALVPPTLFAALVSYDAHGGYAATISVNFQSPIYPSLCKSPTEISVKRFADSAADPEFELAHLDPVSFRKVDDPADVRAYGAPNVPGLAIHHSYTYQICGFYAGAGAKCNQISVWIPLAPPAAPRVVAVCGLSDRRCASSVPAAPGSQGTAPAPPGGMSNPSVQPTPPSGPSQGPHSSQPATRALLSGYQIDWVPVDGLASGFAIARLVGSWQWIAVVDGGRQHSFIDTGDQPWLSSAGPVHTYRVCALGEGWYHSQHATLVSIIPLPPTRSPQTTIRPEDLAIACSPGVSVGPPLPVRRAPGG